MKKATEVCVSAPRFLRVRTPFTPWLSRCMSLLCFPCCLPCSRSPFCADSEKRRFYLLSVTSLSLLSATVFDRGPQP